jgi:hypothetical protein
MRRATTTEARGDVGGIIGDSKLPQQGERLCRDGFIERYEIEIGDGQSQSGGRPPRTESFQGVITCFRFSGQPFGSFGYDWFRYEW